LFLKKDSAPWSVERGFSEHQQSAVQVKKILLKDAKVEGHRCVKREQLPFVNRDINCHLHTHFHRKKNYQYGKRGGGGVSWGL
jgi:transcriptional regulator CtsR